MTFKLPDLAELQQLASQLNIKMDGDKAERLLGYMKPLAAGYEWLDQCADELPVAAPGQGRDCRPPAADENPWGAWLVKCGIKGAASGPLAGKKAAVKDNIFVAGLPLTNGSDFLADLVADFDAIAVTRLLEAGAEITGKAVCEYLCVSGGSATAAGGIVQNPRKPGYSAGGSSSGSAALVAAGAVDLALGTDQGGSVRIPASCCGVVGMKATLGVVPYTGGVPMETSIDNIGPLTDSVADNALCLEVLAAGGDYTQALGQTAQGLKIAVVKEGFGWESSEAVVDECVRAAASRFAALGAKVEEVSIPWHLHGPDVWGGVIAHGIWQTLKMNGLGYNHGEIYSLALGEMMRNWTSRMEVAPINAELILLFGKHLERYEGRYYGKAKNLARRLRAAYDAPLREFDLLLMPTTVTRAARNPASQEQATEAEIMQTAFGSTLNTCQFNATGHPAISIPCGMRDGLPVGMMLVGAHFQEQTLYRAAHAFEQAADWRTL